MFNALRMAKGGVVLTWGFITAVHDTTVDVYLPSGSLLNDRTTVEGVVYARHVKNVVCGDVASVMPGQFTYVCFRGDAVTLGAPDPSEIPSTVDKMMRTKPLTKDKPPHGPV